MVPVSIGVPPNKNLLTFRALLLNNPADEEKSTYHIEEVLVSNAWQQAYEPMPDRDGSQGYEPLDMYKMLNMRGWVRAQSLAELYDKIETLNKTFYPGNAWIADSATTLNRGFMALDFDVPTTDTANYATGKIPSRYYVQALRLPVSLDTKFDNLNARIDFFLRANDPRRYLQTTSTNNRTSNGTLVIANTLASAYSYPSILITLPDAPPAGTGTITTDTGPAAGNVVSIDLTALAASTAYNLDMGARTFVKNSDGTNKINAIVVSSEFFPIYATSQTLTFGGFAAGTTFVVTWRRAFV
jgi:hypothetical protein